MSGSKFKVGDIVRGTPRGIHNYDVTNERMTRAEIIDVRFNDTIELKVLEHEAGCWIGDTFIVHTAHFELVQAAPMDDDFEPATSEELSALFAG